MLQLLLKENQARPASKQVSYKHAGRDRWDGGLSLWPRTGRQESMKRRARAEGNAEMESLCFPSGSLDSVEDGKCFYFTHQSITSHRLYPCHRCVIKHKSSVIICQVSSVDVHGGPLSVFTGLCDREAEMQITSHLSSVGECASYFSHLDAIKLKEKPNLCNILSISHLGSQQLTIQSNYNEESEQAKVPLHGHNQFQNINNRA